MAQMLLICTAGTLLLVLRTKRERVATLCLLVLFVNPGYSVFHGLTPGRILGIALFVAALARLRRSAPIYVKFMLGLAVIGIVYALGSPDRKLGFQDATDLLVAVGVLLYFAKHDGFDGERAKRILQVAAPLVLCASLSIGYFRLHNSSELAYYHTSLARFLQGNYATKIATHAVEANVTSPDKSGGLFFNNGNRASLTMGVAMCTYFAGYVATKSKWLGLLTISCALGVVASGSKTGIALAVLVPFFLWLIAAARRRDGKISILAVLTGMVPIIAVAAYVVRSYAGEYVSAVDETLSPRRVLWSSALRYIEEAPLFGHGYGSWQTHWQPIAYANGLNPDYPPHNYVFLNWINLGLLGALLCVLIPLIASVHLLRGAQVGQPRRVRLAIGASAATWLWVMVHGFGDNTYTYGLLNLVPFLGAGAGLVYSLVSEEEAWADDRVARTSARVLPSGSAR